MTDKQRILAEMDLLKQQLLFIETAERMSNPIQEEPVSKDLERAADKEASDMWDKMEREYDIAHDNFIAGAEWQKNKMMEDAMDGIIAESAGGDGWVNVMTGFVKSKDVNVKFGDKIKLIIIKEE